LSDVALRNLPLLPVRMAPFVRGLHAYGSGQADSAMYWLTQAVQASPRWTEAHMTLGEVYYHLLPWVDGRLDSLAEVEFTAAAADSGFSPARFHLAEIAIRSGDTIRASRAVQDFLRLAQGGPSISQRTALLLALNCVRKGHAGVDWVTPAANAPITVLLASTMLVGGGAFLDCAEGGFRAVFDNSADSLGIRWGAFLGLQGILAAEGRTTELRALIDSAIAGGLALADQLYVLDAMAGVEVDGEAAAVAARTSQDASGKAYSFALWLAGEWRARSGDLAATSTFRDSLVARAARDKNPATARFADVLSSRVVLLEGDTAAAISGLRAALGTGKREELDWGLGESLAPDRLLLADLLLARGRPQEAIAIAAIFDHQAPIVFLPYLPASLTLRRRAALALGEEREARRYESRLASLGTSHRLGNASPSSIPEAP